MPKVPISVQYIKDVFEVEDIDLVWSYLHLKFHFNKTGWKAEFENVLKRSPRYTSPQEMFMIFGKKQIEPLLNEVLGRRNYPTWINLLSFVLRDKIAVRKDRDDKYKNRF